MLLTNLRGGGLEVAAEPHVSRFVCPNVLINQGLSNRCRTASTAAAEGDRCPELHSIRLSLIQDCIRDLGLAVAIVPMVAAFLRAEGRGSTTTTAEGDRCPELHVVHTALIGDRVRGLGLAVAIGAMVVALLRAEGRGSGKTAEVTPPAEANTGTPAVPTTIATIMARVARKRRGGGPASTPVAVAQGGARKSAAAVVAETSTGSARGASTDIA